MLGKVSIITPCYNAGRFIEATIQSVQAQTYPDWELLITDDGSTDHSKAMALKYAKQDSRLRVLETNGRAGPAEARNTSLRQASGEWVAFLDSDDLWLPTKLNRQLHWMNDQGFEFSYTSYRRMQEDGEKLGTEIIVPKQLNYHDILKNTAITTSTVLLKRKLLHNIWMESGWGYDDLLLWLKILNKGVVAYGLNEDLVRYRVVKGSVSGKSLRSAKWVWNIYRKHEKLSLWKSFYSLMGYGSRAILKRCTL